jgi:hypothetical protein
MNYAKGLPNPTGRAANVGDEKVPSYELIGFKKMKSLPMNWDWVSDDDIVDPNYRALSGNELLASEPDGFTGGPPQEDRGYAQYAREDRDPPCVPSNSPELLVPPSQCFHPRGVEN